MLRTFDFRAGMQALKISKQTSTADVPQECFVTMYRNDTFAPCVQKTNQGLGLGGTSETGSEPMLFDSHSARHYV